MKNLQKGFVLPLLLIVIAAGLIGGGSYIYLKEKNNQGLPKTCVDQVEGQPVITSLSSYEVEVGSQFEINGCNFAGFEGDLNAWIENEQGVKGIVYGAKGSTPKNIKVTLESQLCQTDESYRGLPCASFLDLKTGTYKIYVNPWGKNSNAVEFKIKNNSASEIKVNKAEWNGTYKYEAALPPNITMALTVVVDGDKATVNVDGFQAFNRLNATTKVVGQNGLEIVFDSYQKHNVGQPYAKGDVLFTLGRDNLGNYAVNWGKLGSIIETEKAAEIKRTNVGKSAPVATFQSSTPIITKVYKNENFGFEFKYPQKYNPVEVMSLTQECRSIYVGPGITVSGVMLSSLGQNLSVGVICKPYPIENVSLHFNIAAAKPVNFNKIVISGREFFTYEFVTSVGYYWRIAQVSLYNGHVVEIAYSHKNGDQSTPELSATEWMDILESLKLTGAGFMG